MQGYALLSIFVH